MKIKYYIFSLLLFIFTLNSYAFSWQNLWKSKNQQAKEMMKKNDFSHAKNTFKDENWQAVAAFRDKDYQMAADLFAKPKTIDANYNLGNALANLGKYKDAIKAYDEVLAANKNHEDAKHNKKILENFLKQQQKQENSNNKQKQNPKTQEKKNNPYTKNQKEEKKQQTNKKQQNPPKINNKSSENKKKNEKNKNLNKQNSQNKKNGKNQMQEQWLKLIPDDPGGLLREKFKRDYLRRKGELEP